MKQPGPPRFTAGPSRIEGRADGGWIVRGTLVAAPCLITGETATALPGGTPETVDGAALPLADGIELLLLGTGTILKRPPRALTTALAARGIRIEAMDSPAAARTFNVLVAEERLVAVLLF